MAVGDEHSICINIEPTVQVIFHSQLLMAAMGGLEREDWIQWKQHWWAFLSAGRTPRRDSSALESTMLGSSDKLFTSLQTMLWEPVLPCTAASLLGTTSREEPEKHLKCSSIKSGTCDYKGRLIAQDVASPLIHVEWRHKGQLLWV
jgi:hypothetical protein